MFIFRPQQMRLCLPGSSFQLPGLKKFLPEMEKRSHLGPHKCPHSLQWAKQGQQAAINASLTRPASQPEPSLNQTTVQGSWVPTREPGGQTGWAGSLRGGTRGWVSSPTPSVCGREITARNGLPGILLMIGFAFTPRGSYWGLGSN